MADLYRLDVAERQAARVRRHAEVRDRDKVFLAAILQERFDIAPSADRTVVDLGCGKGGMVGYLLELGYDARGCDIVAAWEQEESVLRERLALIHQSPYRLPYEDATVDAVFSTAVLEHAWNTVEVHREVFRILKPGGISVHYYPSKWYLPHEPHIRIPLLNWFWPHCPRWWTSLWLWLRVLRIPRLAPDRKGLLERYCEFCRTDVIYLSNRVHRRLAMQVFGNCGSLMDFYILRADGGFARLARRLPLRRVSAWLGATFRMNLVYQRKIP
jgi:SAM-dependent methyltransferase